jgi:hypothetical protein
MVRVIGFRRLGLEYVELAAGRYEFRLPLFLCFADRKWPLKISPHLRWPQPSEW